MLLLALQLFFRSFYNMDDIMSYQPPAAEDPQQAPVDAFAAAAAPAEEPVAPVYEPPAAEAAPPAQEAPYVSPVEPEPVMEAAAEPQAPAAEAEPVAEAPKRPAEEEAAAPEAKKAKPATPLPSAADGGSSHHLFITSEKNSSQRRLTQNLLSAGGWTGPHTSASKGKDYWFHEATSTSIWTTPVSSWPSVLAVSHISHRLFHRLFAVSFSPPHTAAATDGSVLLGRLIALQPAIVIPLLYKMKRKQLQALAKKLDINTFSKNGDIIEQLRSFGSMEGWTGPHESGSKPGKTYYYNDAAEDSIWIN